MNDYHVTADLDIAVLLANSVANWDIATKHKLQYPEITVLMYQKLYWVCMQHAKSDLEREVGGYVVGRTTKYKGRRYVVAEDALVAQYTDSSRTHITFTAESQIDIEERRQLYYPDKEIVGWFHTHPGWGIFYSRYDHWLHTNFFPKTHQFGLVIDPLQSEAGFFIWRFDWAKQKYEMQQREYSGCIELSDIQSESIIQWNNMFNIKQKSRDAENKFPTESMTETESFETENPQSNVPIAAMEEDHKTEQSEPKDENRQA